jgi:hypothetical protein
MPFASGLPLTERERQACDAKKRDQLVQGLIRRKSTPSGQHYSRKPTAADKRLTHRILGEADE